MGGLPGIIWWTLNEIMCLYKKQAEGDSIERKWKEGLD